MHTIFTLLCVSAMIGACSTGKKTASEGQGQGVLGFVGELTGNQMPGPGRTADPPKPLQTTVYLYALTRLADVEQENGSAFYRSIRTGLVDSVRSDKKGRFYFAAAPGRYSIFTKVDGLFYANLFDGEGNISPVDVKKDELSRVNIIVSDKASF